MVGDNKKMQQPQKKILVCITPQSNSRRLIDHAYGLAKKESGELHILHIEKGKNIFLRSDVSEILQNLFDYGSELGGIVHAICADDIPTAIKDFVKKAEITCVVLGEPPESAKAVSNSIIDKLTLMMPYLKIDVLKRNPYVDI